MHALSTIDKVTELLVSRKYKKELQDRFCL